MPIYKWKVSTKIYFSQRRITSIMQHVPNILVQKFMFFTNENMYQILLYALCSMCSQYMWGLQRNVHVASGAPWFPIYRLPLHIWSLYYISLLLDRQSSSTPSIPSMHVCSSDSHPPFMGLLDLCSFRLARLVCSGSRVVFLSTHGKHLELGVLGDATVP